MSKHYALTHEWVDAHSFRVGISDYAQKELGEVVYVELPAVGTAVSAGQEVAVLESTKAATDIYSPLSGTIKAVNERLRKEPELVNTSAEQDGWLYQIEPSDSTEMAGLQSETSYKALIIH